MMCKEPFLTLPVVIYARKNFFLLEAINERIEILKASGLLEFWLFEDIDRNFIKVKATTELKVFSLEHLSGSFLIYLSMMFGCFVVFLVENVVGVCRKLEERRGKVMGGL
jgi:hypothetical protein